MPFTKATSSCDYMAEDGRRLFQIDPGSSAYDFRLVKVGSEIDDDGAKFEKKLAVLAGITEDELYNLLKLYTTVEIEAAIAERDARESQAGQADSKNSKANKPIGWWAEWQQAVDRREEERRADLQRSKGG